MTEPLDHIGASNRISAPNDASASLSALSSIIAAVAPYCANMEWAEALTPFMRLYNITTPKRIAAFIGQIAVESAGFTRLEENLNYTAKRMCDVWPSRFSNIEEAKPYARNPEKLANRVYCDRMGNGDEASGDGWKYRGAGLIMLTGKENQERFACSEHAWIIVDTDIGEHLRTMKGAADSACWFWDWKYLNHHADGWYISVISRIINGGTHGLDQRIETCNLALKIAITGGIVEV